LEAVPTTLEQLHRAEGVWLANALMGLMPVAAIDGQQIPLSPKSEFLQQILWEETRL